MAGILPDKLNLIRMKVITVLGWFVLGTLAMAIARQLSEQIDLSNTFFSSPRASHMLLQPFTNPATIDTPYTLLNDVLAEKQEASVLTAKTCYEKDFLSQSAKVGNFIQRTNNYRHGTPDNCSAPRTEFVDRLYKNF